MTSIPVTLEFCDITSEHDSCICLSTPHAFWSLAGEGLDDQGFSYNSLQFSDTRPPCLSRIQVRTSTRGSVLELGVKPGSGASSFTLTCYLDVPSTASCIEGFCKLSEDAVVRARFGSAEAVEWRDGKIHGNLFAPTPDIETIILTCVGLSAGESAKIYLMGPAAGIEPLWKFADYRPGNVAFSLNQMSGQGLPLTAVSIAKNCIELAVSKDASGQGDSGFTLETYFNAVPYGTVVGPDSKGCVLLRTDYDGRGWLTAKIGQKLPKVITTNAEQFYF